MEQAELLPMTAAHSASVLAIQQSIYPPCLHEDVALILERAALFPPGSLVGVAAAGRVVLGYCSSYPYPLADALARPPSLGTVEALAVARALAEPARACLFLHEVSVYLQGAGLGSRMVRELLAVAAARRLCAVVLVSVLGNSAYYQRFGFEVVRELPSYACDAAATAAAPPPPPPLPPTPSYHCKEKRAHVMILRL